MHVQCVEYTQEGIHQRAVQSFSDSISPIHDGELKPYTNATADDSDAK